MIIGFDGKRAVQNNTGLGNYSRLLVEKMATIFPDNRYRVYAPRRRENPRLASIEKLDNVAFAYPESGFWRRMPSLWRSWGITNRLKADSLTLYHGLSGELPLNIGRAGIPSIVTIHDLIFRHFPENYRAIDRRIYDYKFRRACLDATRVIAISEKTKADITADYGIDPAKIDVVYQGCDTIFRHRPDDATITEIKRLYGLDRPYIISVGTLEPRKNQLQAVEGLAALPQDLGFLLVGRRSDYARRVLDPAIARLRLTERVKFLEGIPFAHLPALYAGALLSSYTSRYEGFGLPVIESLSVGTPVIAATGSCLEEAGGPDTPAIDPDSVEQWATTAMRFITDRDYAISVGAKGREYVGRFSHEAMARGTMATYLAAIESYSNK